MESPPWEEIDWKGDLEGLGMSRINEWNPISIDCICSSICSLAADYITALAGTSFRCLRPVTEGSIKLVEEALHSRLPLKQDASKRQGLSVPNKYNGLGFNEDGYWL